MKIYKFNTPQSRQNVFKVLLLSATIIFFLFFLHDLEYKALADISIVPSFLLVSAVFSMGYRYFGVWVWRNILVDLGTREIPSFKILSLIYAKAWMARYIPGTVTWVAAKVFLALKLGISKSRLGVASFVEIGTQIVSVSAISLVLIVFDNRLSGIISPYIKIPVALAVFMLVLILIPKNFNALFGAAYTMIKKCAPSNELSTNTKTMVRSSLMYAVGAFISGTVYYFLACSIWPEVSVSDYFYIVGASNLAGVIGILTPLVPSGFGTRDASLLLLLSVIFPKEIALTVTVASRLWTAIIDLLFYAIVSIIAVNVDRK